MSLCELILVDSIKMGTTVATNALLERKGTKTAFVVTKGFGDLLTIGNQSRPKMFDLAINRPEVLHSKVIEIHERVTLEDWTERKDTVAIDISTDKNLVEGITGEIVRILQPLGRLTPSICFCSLYLPSFQTSKRLKEISNLRMMMDIDRSPSV